LFWIFQFLFNLRFLKMISPRKVVLPPWYGQCLLFAIMVESISYG